MTHLKLGELRRILCFWRWRRVHRRGVVLLCSGGVFEGYTWTGLRVGTADIAHLSRELSMSRGEQTERVNRVSAQFRAQLARRYGGHR